MAGIKSVEKIVEVVLPLTKTAEGEIRLDLSKIIYEKTATGIVIRATYASDNKTNP